MFEYEYLQTFMSIGFPTSTAIQQLLSTKTMSTVQLKHKCIETHFCLEFLFQSGTQINLRNCFLIKKIIRSACLVNFGLFTHACSFRTVANYVATITHNATHTCVS